MRENKGKKGERRSSLSLRGRRASSLIDSGSSNGKPVELLVKCKLTLYAALPHEQVEATDFFKHIESEGLPEPRRMKQLLTWCATRCLDQKPMGASFEESSAIAAARVIEDEVLKDLGNKSELSDWFSREDVAEAPKALPERPNPKNIQNNEKIAELEQQIQRQVSQRVDRDIRLTKPRLKAERDALEALLKPPQVNRMQRQEKLDITLLSSEEAQMLAQLESTASTISVHKRMKGLYTKLEPTVDAFADQVHKVAQYRDAADNVASRVLSIAAEKLAEREKDSRRQAHGGDGDAEITPRRELGSVLRGLSRADR
jgi:kinetochore protein Mis13/DSN1